MRATWEWAFAGLGRARGVACAAFFFFAVCVVSRGLAFSLPDRGAAAILRAYVILGGRLNGIGEAGAVALADALRTNTALTSLNLWFVALAL